MNNEYFELVLNLPKQVSLTNRQVRFDINPNLLFDNCIIEGRVLVDDVDPIKDEIEQWYRLLYDTDAISLVDLQCLKVSANIYKYNEQCLLVGKWNLVGVYPILINKRIYKDKEFFGLSSNSYVMYIDFSLGNYSVQEIQTVDAQPEETTITRDGADYLIVRMMQSNRLCFLADDLHTALLNYRTPDLDEQTSKKFYNYIKYIEGMQKELKNEFLNLKSDVIRHMSE